MSQTQGYDVGYGYVTEGTVCQYDGNICTVTDLTQDGDVTVEFDGGKRITTKWRYVVPLEYFR